MLLVYSRLYRWNLGIQTSGKFQRDVCATMTFRMHQIFIQVLQQVRHQNRNFLPVCSPTSMWLWTCALHLDCSKHNTRSPIGLHRAVLVLQYLWPYMSFPKRSSATGYGYYDAQTMSQCSDLAVAGATWHGMEHGICPIVRRQSWRHSLFFHFECRELGHRIALRK